MPEPEKPQPAAVMLSVAERFAADARLRAAACQTDLLSHASMVQSMEALAGLLRVAGQESAASVLDTLSHGLRGLGAALDTHRDSFAAHAEGWTREAGVWRQVLEKQPVGGET